MTKRKDPKDFKKNGRPTKYREEFCDKYEEYKAQEISVPTREGFARYLGVISETVMEWGKQYPKFSDTLKKLEEDQKHMTIQFALNGTFNAGFSKFLLSANHGMVEKKEIDHTSKGETIAPQFNVLGKITRKD